MSTVSVSEFPDFFREAYDGRDPFPWQVRLANRVCGGDWPVCVSLPTAAGKTACIDIAVFALACQAELHPGKRTAPRRIFFVVDRRVVVDQAYEHAIALAEKLRTTKNGIIRHVADALRLVGADENRPLDVYALRGGMYRESAWVRSPLQPTIITSTVDQVGSRLLFRGYGVSDASKPLHAALIGNDALILLDEAHCARPFDQTMGLVTKYRSWAQEPLRLPFQYVTMTATPSSHENQVERLQQDDRMHPVLGPRIKARKPAALVTAKRIKGSRGNEEIVRELVSRATELQKEGIPAVGVVVNRVATARDAAIELRQKIGDKTEIVLLTGRMRPMDRDAIMKNLDPLLSGSAMTLQKPTIVVATQCIEVGADLDFHALVTECASLDALRQRFGRLNRVAARDNAKAVIVTRADQAKDSEGDPIYGSSLARTWKWLNDHAADGCFDFGVEAVCSLTDNMARDELAALNAPSKDAAVLLPAHIDAWCQTSPRPAPDPDPAYFLHGPERGKPEVQVVFRADLFWDETRSREANEEDWIDIVSLCPPSASEAARIPIRDFMRWLRNENVDEASTDVEGERIEAEDDADGQNGSPTGRCALRWRGPASRETTIVCAPDRITPEDVYIIPISQRADAALLADFPTTEDADRHAPDIGDRAFQHSRDIALLRLRHDIYPQLDSSFDRLDLEHVDGDVIEAKITEAIQLLKDHPAEAVRRAADNLAPEWRRVVKSHPLGGLVLIGKHRLHQFDPSFLGPAFLEPEESWEGASDRPYFLIDHCKDVAVCAGKFAEKSALEDFAGAIQLAGELHDIGKADPRFQAWLHSGNRRRADLYPSLLAKSFEGLKSQSERLDAQRRAEYPKRARHELVSVRLAESDGALPFDSAVRDLILHLIGAHHGYCRPFAPVINDLQPVEVACAMDGVTYRASSATGLERLGSGVAERFWNLTRRFGWWGLAYLEAMLRLADWKCSEPPETSGSRTHIESAKLVETTAYSEAVP